MKQGTFTIASSFMDEGNPLLDKLFQPMVVLAKKRQGDTIIYKAISPLFNEKDATSFVICFDGEKFIAFGEKDVIPDGLLNLSEPGAKAIFQTINKGKTNLKELSESIQEATEKPHIIDFPAYPKNYFELLKLAKSKGFKPELHKDKKKPTLIKFLDSQKKKNAETIKSLEITGENFVLDARSLKTIKSDEQIKVYEVTESDMVKNQSGFLQAGAIINDSMEFDNTIDEMLKAGWIKEVEE